MRCRSSAETVEFLDFFVVGLGGVVAAPTFSGVLCFGTSGWFIEILLVWGWLQCLGGLLEQVEDRPLLRFEAALLGIGEALGGKLEGSEIHQDLPGACQALLEPGGQRPDERGALRVRPYDRERLCQQPRPFRIRGSDAVGGDEGERFALTQPMALRRADDVFLSFLAHGAQGIGKRRPDRPLVDLAGDARGKSRGQGQPAHDPGLAPAEQLRDSRQTEPVFVEQGLDDARFIHRRRRARRGVRAQQQELLLDRRAGALDDRRHERPPLVRPAGESFEAVDDLKETVSGLDDADGQVLELRRRVAAHLKTPQPLVTRTHERNRNRAHECCRLMRLNRATRSHHRCGGHGRAR
jgi:hypothetical protein